MILYHFTGRDHAEKIKVEGITKGAIFIPPLLYIKNAIWLTDDPRFNAQNWATNNSGLCGDRTEIRFMLEIIGAVRWNDFAKKNIRMTKTMLDDFNLAGASDGAHWFIAKAPISIDKIIEVTSRINA